MGCRDERKRETERKRGKCRDERKREVNVETKKKRQT